MWHQSLFVPNQLAVPRYLLGTSCTSKPRRRGEGSLSQRKAPFPSPSKTSSPPRGFTDKEREDESTFCLFWGPVARGVTDPRGRGLVHVLTESAIFSTVITESVQLPADHRHKGIACIIMTSYISIQVCPSRIRYKARKPRNPTSQEAPRQIVLV